MVSKTEIEALYVNQSLRKVADLLGLSYSGLQYWIEVYGIHKRSRSEAQTGTRNHAFGQKGQRSKRFGHRHTAEMKENLSQSRIGIGNPRWKGGITSFTNRLRQIKEYKAWRKACLTRDKSCQQCQSLINLEVDHLQKLSVLLVRFQVTSIEKAKSCQALWDVQNGKVLCHSCHRKKHFRT